LSSFAGERIEAILQLAPRGEHLRALLFQLRAPLHHLLTGIAERAAATDLHAGEQRAAENREHCDYRHRQCQRPAELELSGSPVSLGEDDDVHAVSLLPSNTSQRGLHSSGAHPARPPRLTTAGEDTEFVCANSRAQNSLATGVGRKTDKFVLYILATPLS